MMALESAPTAATASKAFTDAQVVVLRVQGVDYAVPINRVQEIVRVPEITRVPHAQAGVEGVINLRGRVLPGGRPGRPVQRRLELPGHDN